jgi:chromosome segregation ATPase
MTFLKALPLVAAVGIAVGSAGTSPAGQPRRKDQPTPAEAAASAAQEAAAAAKDKLTAIKDELADLNKSVQQAKDEVKAAAEALRKVESELEDGQASSSAFGRARDAFRAAEKLHAAAREQALGSPQYKEQYDKAKQSEDTAALATLRKETLARDATVQTAMAKLKQAKSVYEPLRTALLEGDENWTAASEELQSKKQSLKDAEDELHKAIAKERAAAADAKKAAAAAAQATAAANAQPSQPGSRHHH